MPSTAGIVALLAAIDHLRLDGAPGRARLGELETVWWLYALSIVNSAANTIVMAARQAIVPRLIPRELLPAASALNGITFGIMVMAGPALAGVLVAFAGYAWTYTIDVVLMTSLFLGLWTLPSIRPEGAIVRPGLESLRDGWRFLKRASNIRLQFILDITAMTFGQPLALMPAIGAVLLGGGPITTGALTASVAVGAFLSSLFSGPGRSGAAPRARHRARDPRVRRLDRRVRAGAGGGRTGLVRSRGSSTQTSPNIVLIVAAALCLVVSGGADNVSSIFRNTMVQAAVPDAIRGRLQGVFIVVVAGGPRLGALYAGTLATLTALWFPPLLGGFVIIGLVVAAGPAELRASGSTTPSIPSRRPLASSSDGRTPADFGRRMPRRRARVGSRD